MIPSGTSNGTPIGLCAEALNGPAQHFVGLALGGADGPTMSALNSTEAKTRTIAWTMHAGPPPQPCPCDDSAMNGFPKRRIAAGYLPSRYHYW